MLSIAKLVASQAKYYLDQAEARVDTVQSVADGLEDYYVAGTEARGGWLGRGAAELGLDGAVTGDDLRAVLAGRRADDGAALRDPGSRARVAAFDLTFSAPKSVSVVFGVGDDEMRDAARTAHDVAVREAFAYVERSAAFVRRGPGGVELQPAGGLVAAAFRHRTSRAGDPQLHTHVLVANLARGTDGRWSALDGRRIYAHARAASFIYQAVLRGELSRSLGIEWTAVENGIAEIEGVPPSVLRAFSRRRAEIERAMTERGTDGARAAEAAALASRRPKDRRQSVERLAVEWREQARAHGFDAEAIERIRHRRSAPRLERADWERVRDGLLSAEGLTRRHPTFSRREVIQELCDRLPAGTPVDAAALERAVDRLLGSQDVVALVAGSEDADAESFRRRDGRRVPVLRSDLVYSTARHLAVEQRLVDTIGASQDAGVGIARGHVVRAAIARRPSLSDEQRAMVERLCSDGASVAVVAGHAGTGKTFALAAAREAWEASGQPVRGAAIARRAARELEDGAGIPSTSVAALLAETQRALLARGCVLVVDEAGMLPTRQLVELLAQVQAAEGKLVLVGDHRQLPEMEAGGAFLGLVRRGLAIELRENRRQVHAWEREALEHLRDGRIETALRLYGDHNRLRIEGAPDDARLAMLREWWAAGDPDGAVMIARRRVDVEDLNARARRLLRATGHLGPDELRLPGGDFAVGDRVVVKRNEGRLDIRNGDRGRVLAVDEAAGRLTLDIDGRAVAIGLEFLLDMTASGEPTLLHGYAITGHVAQGMTARQAFVLADEGLTREWPYTAMSRGRDTNVLYFAAEAERAREEFAPGEQSGRAPIERLAAALERSGATPLAIDTGRAVREPDVAGDAQDWEETVRRARQLADEARARRHDRSWEHER